MKEYIITHRNKANNVFRIADKNNETKIEVVSESELIRRTENKQDDFYTTNEDGQSFTKVIVSEGNLRSVPNDTKKDNISTLPRI
jgi:hypothetical protein